MYKICTLCLLCRRSFTHSVNCKLRHAVTLNFCALIKINHAQRRAPIRKATKKKITKSTSQLVLYDCMGSLLRSKTQDVKLKLLVSALKAGFFLKKRKESIYI